MSDLQKPAVKPAAPAAAPVAPEPVATAQSSSPYVGSRRHCTGQRSLSAEPLCAIPDIRCIFGSCRSGVTIEYQRQQAKAMQAYFRDQKVEEATMDAQVFGWTRNNEIGNGRWVMMGLAIGLLTEFATAVNFIDQIKLMVSYLGIADIYD
jgi:hypothetical protein